MATAANRERSGSNQTGQPDTSASRAPGSFKIPLVLMSSLLLLSFAPRIQSSPLLVWSFWGACAALMLWQVYLFISANRAGETHGFSIALRPQHYIQTMTISGLSVGNYCSPTLLIYCCPGHVVVTTHWDSVPSRSYSASIFLSGFEMIGSTCNS